MDPELVEVLRRRHKTADEVFPAVQIVQVARAASPSQQCQAFRSGWSCPLQVQTADHTPFGYKGSLAASRSASTPARSSPPEQNSGAGSEYPPSRGDGGAVTLLAGAPRVGERSSGGWLSKRVSGKAEQWQRRYFVLDGCSLHCRYAPRAAAERSLDLRRARISLAGQAREFELDFGFGVWHLRAESPEAALRWHGLLEAARLTGSGPLTGLTTGNDGSPHSPTTCSTKGSTTSPRTPPEVPPAPDAIAAEDVSRRITDRIGGGALVLGIPVQTESQAALQVLQGVFDVPGADGASVCEKQMMMRLKQNLERWLSSDPTATEVMDVAKWFALEARSIFCRRDGQPPECSESLDDIEHMLLSEWEARSCDEFCRQCEAVYNVGNLGCSAMLAPKARANIIIEILRSVLQLGGAWHGHRGGCDRAASIQIATLNSALRSYRAYARQMVLAVQTPLPARGGATKRSNSFSGVTRAFRNLGGQNQRRAAACPADGAALEATALASFCAGARAELTSQDGVARTQTLREVLIAFENAFTEEVAGARAVVATGSGRFDTRPGLTSAHA